MDVITAIDDPVRRDILMLLRDRVMAAGEIASCFDISRPAVSRHLRVLRECGLVVAEVRGRQRLYRIDTGPLASLESWLEALRDPWPTRLDALATEVYRVRRERRTHSSTEEEKTA